MAQPQRTLPRRPSTAGQTDAPRGEPRRNGSADLRTLPSRAAEGFRSNLGQIHRHVLLLFGTAPNTLARRAAGKKLRALHQRCFTARNAGTSWPCQAHSRRGAGTPSYLDRCKCKCDPHPHLDPLSCKKKGFFLTQISNRKVLRSFSFYLFLQGILLAVPTRYFTSTNEEESPISDLIQPSAWADGRRPVRRRRVATRLGIPAQRTSTSTRRCAARPSCSSRQRAMSRQVRRACN